MKKHVLGKALLICIIVALLAAETWAAPVIVKLANKTNAKIFVALAQMSTGGEDSGDLVKGWFAVNPGKTRTVKFGSYSPVNEYFYYAVSGRRVWAGKRDEGTAFWIHPKNAFTTRSNRKISGGKKVRFRSLGVSSAFTDEGMEGKARVTFKK